MVAGPRPVVDVALCSRDAAHDSRALRSLPRVCVRARVVQEEQLCSDVLCLEDVCLIDTLNRVVCRAQARTGKGRDADSNAGAGDGGFYHP